MRSLVRAALVGTCVVLTTAHVGSPNAFFVGRAGPYDVSVIVRPPAVVPGLAEVIVRVPGGEVAGVNRVLVRAVYWRTGRAGSPRPDEATRIAAPDPTWTGKLWLMAHGAYMVDVQVVGTRGTGLASVPVDAAATAQLALSPFLKALLVVLGFVLFAGMLTIVRAAAGEALVAPGAAPGPERRRGARIATAVASPALALLLLGGWKWWTGAAAAYRRTLDRPLAVATSVVPTSGGTRLHLQVTDSLWTSGRLGPLMPDHGKMMHLFLVRTPVLDVFAHLHPLMTDASTFEGELPPVPAGHYAIYADVVHETGYERTLVSSIDLRQDLRQRSGGDPDDAMALGSSTLPDSVQLRMRLAPEPLSTTIPTELSFQLVDRRGQPVAIQPYLGMPAHAVIMRTDGSVFVHLHPMGSVSPAAQRALDLRDAGDTTADGRLAIGVDGAATGMAMGAADGKFGLVYQFPRSGPYRMWVQFRYGGRIQTAAYDLRVREGSEE